MQIALSVGFKILPGVTFTELITQYFKVTGKLNQVYLEHCSNVFACACAFNSPLWLLSELFCREHRSLQLNEPRANDSSFWFLWIIDDSFSPASKSYFLSPLFDTEVFMRATWFEWLKTTSPNLTNYVIGCILLNGSLLAAIPAILHSILGRQGHSAPVLPLHLLVSVSFSAPCVIELFLSSHSSASLSLLLFSLSWISLCLPTLLSFQKRVL